MGYGYSDKRIVSVHGLDAGGTNRAAKISDTGYLYTNSKLVNDDSNSLTIDTITRAISTVDYAHHEIHAGSHYFYMSHHDMPKNTVNNHLIVTPNTTKWAHIIFSYDSTAGQVHIEFSEDATYSDIGTLETAINRNRNFPDASTTLIYEDPTITGQGNILFSQKLGGDDKKLSIGGGARGSNEIVLKQNTVYLFRATELDVAATIMNIELDWYEHVNRA